MSDPTERLRQKLQAAQDTIAELQAHIDQQKEGQRLALLELEENRSALLFMLEDLDAERKKVEQAHREWMAALDVVDAPIFLHDREFRILRCNEAYRQCAGIPFKQIIGRPYYEVFPKSPVPLSACLRAMGKAEEEVMVGDAVYRSRAFSIRDAQGAYLHSVHLLEDITERRRIDNLLREDEQNYRTLADSAPALIWTSGPDKLCNYFNRPWLEFTGRTLEQEMGNGWVDGVHPDDLPRCLEVYLSAFDRREPFSMEYRLRRHDGEFRWMRDDGQPRYDSNGNFTSYIGFLMDITERRHAESVLQESEEKFRKITWAAQDAIVMMGPDRRISFWNTAAERIFGYVAEEAIGQDLHSLITPADAQAAFAQGFRHFLESGEGPVVGKVIEVTALRRGGEEFPAELSVSATRLNEQWHAIGIVRDITERKHAEEELLLRAQLLDSTSDSIFVHDPDGNFVYLNEAAWKTRGYTRDELMEMNLHALDVQEYEKLIEVRHGELMEKGQSTFESAHHHKDGSVIPIEVSARIIESGGRKLILAAARDITERKQAEQTLRESEKLYRSLFENMLNGFAYHRMIFEQDQPQDYIFLSVNAAFETMTGLKNVAGRRVSEVIPGIRQSEPGLFEIYGRVSLSGKPERFETYVEALQQWFWISVYSPAKGYFVTVFDVITERKRAEKALIESRRRVQHYLDVASVMLVSLDTQGRVQMVNRKGCEMLGYPEAEILGKDWFDNYLPEAVREEVRKVFGRMMGGDIAPIEYFENDILTANGDTLTVAWHNTLLLDDSGKISGTLASGEDITARKEAEAAIRHANRALATLSAVNRSLVRAGSEEELLQSICQAIIRQRGYRLACVGYRQQDEDKSIRVMAHAGEGEGCTQVMQFTWAETEHGMGPSGRAVRSGTTQLSQDIANDPKCLPWRAAARQQGYAANIALPLLNGDGTVFGVLNVYAGEVNAFTAHEIELLEEMAGDLAFGVRTLHTRHERDLAMEQSQQHLKQLHDSLEDTVRAMAGLVEMRDPYTAGHQARVADLAMAIARQIGLPAEQVHAIHLAGTVHDLGKIQVPAEILSKPGKINNLEFGLIKIHPQAGYDILKGIDFPWPIAQMVYQHHERLDGSGYPQGLKGEQIIIEARILSVADVVEAMSSHRPYRPSLGIEAALEEISKQRGVHYDSQVADACLAVFREGYRFK